MQGFMSLCNISLPENQIKPGLVNWDIVENIFCMQRSIYSGANTNPDASQYRYMKAHYY